jgi:hypothetical protein
MRRPPFLVVMAIFGLLLGSFGALYAINNATLFLMPRDAYSKSVHEQAEKLIPDEGLRRFQEQRAEAEYDRRNTALPLAGMNVLLSCLLVAGCARALRGSAWGASAWSVAALGSIPYHLIDGAFAVVKGRDYARLLSQIKPPGMEIMQTGTQLGTRLQLFFAGLEILYFGACLIYLRSPTVKRLFSDDAAGTRPSA